ncbi:zinc finger protein RFP-like [Protobothrops mucrosquamatus]|uniref:zinc finger protein RFP-like n=1 Tax=Protobothrops mucrosquamatus TaxID=103944 RepID=UPI000775C2DA|nr:zinc finger protein RFP-like [Protobothrops mucrosquamatus]
MAAAASMEDFLEEATCCICLDYFQDPVLIPECGHNFCRGCLTRSWGTSESEASCPQCRQTFGPRNVLPNRQLVRLVEIARRCGGPWGEDGGSLCQKHREPLKLFCKHHETLICVVCNLSQEHRGHSVIPAEEALQEYQIKVGDCLKAQKEEKEEIATYKTDTEQRVQEMLVSIDPSLRIKDNIRDLCSLDDLIQEIEEKHQQPASKLLQDIGSILKKYQAKKIYEYPVNLLVDPMWTIWDYSDFAVLLKNVMKKFRDTLESGLQLQEVNVILDRCTAHPGLLYIREDGKCVRGIKPAKEIYPSPNSTRFECCPYVLGCQRFSTGRRFWEVSVRNTKGWRVGITNMPVNVTNLDEQARHWQVYKWEKEYVAISPSVRSDLVLTEKPTRIRISLNCEGGQVSFFDARTAALLCTFSDASLIGETLLPSFRLYEGNSLSLP